MALRGDIEAILESRSEGGVMSADARMRACSDILDWFDCPDVLLFLQSEGVDVDAYCEGIGLLKSRVVWPRPE